MHMLMFESEAAAKFFIEAISLMWCKQWISLLTIYSLIKCICKKKCTKTQDIYKCKHKSRSELL